MPKYYFKLQPLLDKERILEDEYIRGFRILKEALQDEENKLKRLEKRKIKYQKKLKERKQHHITVAELRLYEDYFTRLENEISNSKHMLGEITKRTEAVQDELTKIVKKRKALEKLKERGMEEYLNDLYLSLNKEMDDIAMINFTKRQLKNA